MATGQSNQSSSIKPEYLLCCGCCIIGLLIGAFMFLPGFGFEGLNGELGENASQQACIENCLEDNYGNQTTANIGIGTNNIACLAIGNSKYTPQLRAFMRAITNAEGTADIQGYYRMFGGKIYPTNTDRHPGSVDCTLHGQNQFLYGYNSDAYGRYQFISTTFRDWASRANIPTVGANKDCDGHPFYNINPQYQDIATATELINRGIEKKLLAGNLASAMSDVADTWTSVPGGSQQNAKSDQFASLYGKLLEEEKRGKCNSSNYSSTNKTGTTINNIPYYNQTDFPEPLPSVGCGIASSSMLSEFMTGTKTTPQDFYSKYQFSLLNGISNLTKLNAVETKFNSLKPTESWDLITKNIDNNNPLIIFTGYLRTSNNDKNYGHIMLIKGYTKDTKGNITEIIVNDPYGDLSKKNYTKNGETAHYPIDEFTKRVTEITHNEGSKIYYIENYQDAQRSNISNSNSYSGYTPSQIDSCTSKCSTTNSNLTTQNCSEARNKVIEFAIKQIGKCYCSINESGSWYGGTGGSNCSGPQICISGHNVDKIDGNSFDCAGLVGSAWTYATENNKYFHSLVYTFETNNEFNIFTAKSLEELYNNIQPGDAIYGGKYYGEYAQSDWGHIGIYIGPLEYNGIKYQHAVIDASGGDYGVLIREFEQGSWKPTPNTNQYMYGTPKECSSNSNINSTQPTNCSNLSKDIKGSPNQFGLVYPLDTIATPKPYMPDNGVDLNTPRGTTVRSVMDGEVILSDDQAYIGKEYKGTINDRGRIRIKHSDGTASYYTHLSCRSAKVGDIVKAGQAIGKSGTANEVSHLHFGLYINAYGGDDVGFYHPYAIANRISGKIIFSKDEKGIPIGYDNIYYYSNPVSDNVYGKWSCGKYEYGQCPLGKCISYNSYDACGPAKEGYKKAK